MATYKSVLERIIAKGECSYLEGEQLRKMRSNVQIKDIEWLKTNKSDPWSQKELGNCYLLGQGVSQSNDLAFQCYSNAASLSSGKNSFALFCLARCHEYGIGTVLDRTKAKELFQKAADLDNAKAIYTLAYELEWNEDESKCDEAKAVQGYVRAAKLGSHQAMSSLSTWYLNFRPVQHDLIIMYLRNAIRADALSGPPIDSSLVTKLALFCECQSKYDRSKGEIEKGLLRQEAASLKIENAVVSGDILYAAALFAWDLSRKQFLVWMRESAETGYEKARLYLQLSLERKKSFSNANTI